MHRSMWRARTQRLRLICPSERMGRAERARAYYLAHAEEKRAYARRYYREHREEVLAKVKECRLRRVEREKKKLFGA